MSEKSLIINEPLEGFWRGFRLRREGSFPAVLLLHGSGGYNSPDYLMTAMFLAMHGYLAVPFGYSNGTTPWDAGVIWNVELENTANAIYALKENPLCTGKVGLIGSSRGAEHATLLSSLMAKEGMDHMPDCLIAHANANIIFPAFDSRCARPKSDPSYQNWDWEKDAWIWHGSADTIKPGNPIELEHYPNPILLAHGTADNVWHSGMTEELEKRLTENGRTPEVHYFEGEGHGFSTSGQNQYNEILLDFLERTLH